MRVLLPIMWMSFMLMALVSYAERVQAVYRGQEDTTQWGLMMWFVVCVAVSVVGSHHYKEDSDV